jgi:hypothetical protein
MRIRGAEITELLVRMKGLRLRQELVFRFGMISVRNATIDGANSRALFLIKMPDAFRALFRNDVVEIRRKRLAGLAIQFPLHAACIDGGVGALRFAGTAIDTFFSDFGSHSGISSSKYPLVVNERWISSSGNNNDPRCFCHGANMQNRDGKFKKKLQPFFVKIRGTCDR